ncbi:MAG: S8 family serine peptidase [Candidatus Poseidoniaceae archaeon]|nr:S8 family serine peptidase [Candidatus Poseidoniaceae archaeon]
MLHPTGEQTDVSQLDSSQTEWVRFDLVDGVYSDAVGEYDYTNSLEDRPNIASSRIGDFDQYGFTASRPLPMELMQARPDLSLLIVDDSIRMEQARQQLNDIQGLMIRELIAPSGLLIQGTSNSIQQASDVQGVVATHQVPLALLIDDAILDVMMLTDGTDALQGQAVRLEGWRDELGPVDSVELTDEQGFTIFQSLEEVSKVGLSEIIKWDEGRYEGQLNSEQIAELIIQPSVRSFRFNPQFTIDNDNARSNMKTTVMTSYFTTDLDGSGQMVAVADSGLDGDHGDFGTRVVSSNDVIGDGSTADTHSGHGTHVACTVLGDGTQGGYAGVAPAAELYFQAMENDNTGNFQSPSLNYLMNTAYSAGARTHTNSWGAKDASQQGKYDSEAEDVDDRANYYDKYYNGREGLTILFAAGNDGPGTGTVSPPATAKNILSVGNHQNRYSGAPDSLMSSSSRGPTDDGRIKPDIIAPGGYVRSCRAQEATDTSGSTWSNNWYLEYTGTSMATPNAAGAAAMVREYLEEIAQRPAPQGALVKALLVLGAQDIGTRDIPNNDEGWGRINLRETLAPQGGQGIWVDDRSVLSGSGNSKSYTFNLTQNNGKFKVVLTWSDERGSSFSTKKLVNNLDLIVTSPDGTIYKGNDFANGVSTTGGSADDTNNLEVVLLDYAMSGVWTVKAKNTYQGGSSAQTYSIAVMGHGVNDLRPDPMVMVDDFSMDVSIPQVGDQVHIETKVFNAGNVEAESFDVVFSVNATEITRKNIDLGAGSAKTLFWTWTPVASGQTTLTFTIDPDDDIEEILENNNQHNIVVNVTAPGVKLSSSTQTTFLDNTQSSATSWNVSLTNTALISTNASLFVDNLIHVESNLALSWYVGTTQANHSLEGQQSTEITVTLVHPTPPDPGTYRISLIGIDVDNGVNYPYALDLVVPSLSKVNIEYDYQIVPVHPVNTTSIDVRFFNIGNDDIGYDLFLEAPAGWQAGFDDLGSEPGAISGSTGLIGQDSQKNLGITFTPPQVMTGAGAERMVKLTAVSQTENPVSYVYNIPIKVMEIRDIDIDLQNNFGKMRPDSSLSLMFSIQNKGNIDLDLTPSIQLPSGWQWASSTDIIELNWASTRNIIVTVNSQGSGKSGEIQFNLDNGSDRYSWTGYIDVEILAQPTLDFASLQLEDGTSYGHPLGTGSHPSGESLNFTWLVGNNADVDWEPSVSVILDPGLFGECQDVGVVGYLEFQFLQCSILISGNMAPKSEPSFTVILEGNGVEYVEQVGLYVASVESAIWDASRNEKFATGVVETVSIDVTNSGNVAWSYKIQAIASENWYCEVIGNDVISLEAGQSKVVRINVRADRPGDGTITLQFEQSNPLSNPSVSFDVSAEGEPTGTSSESFINNGVAIALILVILSLIGVVLYRNSKSEKKNLPSINSLTSSSANQLAAPIAAPLPQTFNPQPIIEPIQAIEEKQENDSQPVTMCWLCKSPVTEDIIGCPSCGARYHGVAIDGCDISQLEHCANCQALASEFIKA